MTSNVKFLLLAGLTLLFASAHAQVSIEISDTAFNKGHIDHVFQLVQGKIAGLSVSKPGSDPNGFIDVRVRGLRSLVPNTMPVIVIDGAVQAFPENADPYDIQSVRLINNASEASHFGLPGGSGILLIETRIGEPGKPVVSYNTRFSAETPVEKGLFMNATEWRALSDELGIGTDLGTSTNWPDEITRTAFSHAHNLSFSGGNELSQFRASVNYRSGQGIQNNSGYSQINGRISVSQKALKQRFVMQVNAAATQRKSHYGFAGAFKYALLSNPTAPVRSDDPLYDRYDGYFTQMLFDNYNPVHIINKDRNEGLTRIFSFSTHAALRITDRLTLHAIYALQNYNTTGIQYFGENEPWGGINQNGFAIREENDAPMRQLTGTLEYERKLGISAQFRLKLGLTTYNRRFEGFYATQNNMALEDLSFKNLFDKIKGLDNIKNGTSLAKNFSFYFSSGLEKKDFYYFKINGSTYSTSILSGNNMRFYGGVNAGLNMMKLIDPSIKQDLFVKAGYGFTGNEMPWNYLSYYRSGTQSNISYNGNYFSNFLTTGHSNLKIPVISELNIGIDFNNPDKVFSGSLVFYSAVITDPVIKAQVPVPPNLYSTMLVNLGKIKDSGLELTVNKSLGTGAWSLNMMLTAAYSLSNKAVSLSGNGFNYGTKDLGNVGSPGQNQVPIARVEEGQPFGQLLSLEYKNIDEGGNMVFVDQPGTSTGIDQEDRIIAGNALPKFITGYSADFRYGKFDVNISFRGVFGHHLLNTYRALYEVPNMISTYNLPQTAGSLKNQASGAYLNHSTGMLSDRHIENASFVSLDNMSIGYRISISQNRLLHMYVAGNNLFYLTRYKGIDPNPRYGDSVGNYTYDPLIPGIERTGTWFRTRSFTLGAGLTL